MMGVRETIDREFDQFSSDYTSDMMRCVPFYKDLISNLSSCLSPDLNVENILDLGCGNGNATRRLMMRFPKARYTLVDASPEMIQLCRNRFAGMDVAYFLGFFSQFEFKPSHYDLIIASFSFHHLESSDKKQIFKECHRSLTLQGRLLMADLMISKSHPGHWKLLDDWKSFVLSNYEDTSKWEWLMEHYDAFDRPDLYTDQVSWLREAGFREISIPWQQGFWTLLSAIK